MDPQPHVAFDICSFEEVSNVGWKLLGQKRDAIFQMLSQKPISTSDEILIERDKEFFPGFHSQTTVLSIVSLLSEKDAEQSRVTFRNKFLQLYSEIQNYTPFNDALNFTSINNGRLLLFDPPSPTSPTTPELKTIQEKKMNEAKIGNDLEHHLVLYKQTRDWFCLFLQQELSDIVLVLVDTITQEVRTRLEDLMNVWSSNQWINFKKSVYILHFVESGTSESQFQERLQHIEREGVFKKTIGISMSSEQVIPVWISKKGGWYHMFVDKKEFLDNQKQLLTFLVLCGDIKRRVGSHEKVAFLELLLLTLRKALYPLFFESIGNLCLQRKDKEIVLCAKPYASTPSLTYKIGKVRYDEYHFIACIPPFVPKEIVVEDKPELKRIEVWLPGVASPKDIENDSKRYPGGNPFKKGPVSAQVGGKSAITFQIDRKLFYECDGKYVEYSRKTTKSSDEVTRLLERKEGIFSYNIFVPENFILKKGSLQLQNGKLTVAFEPQQKSEF